MRRDAPNVFHDGGRIFKNGSVEPLQNKPAAVKSEPVSLVDVAAAEWFGVEQFSRQLKLASEGADIGRHIHAAKIPALMTTVAMAAATTTNAPDPGFFARVRIVAGTGGSEGGKFLVQLGGTTVRTFRAAPLGGADEDFGIAFALGAMKFVNRHGAK
jgi:hypothetical protein